MIGQIQAIKCAHADLQGALQSWHQNDPQVHDWRAHEQTIDELERAFPFLTDERRDLGSVYEAMTVGELDAAIATMAADMQRAIDVRDVRTKTKSPKKVVFGYTFGMAVIDEEEGTVAYFCEKGKVGDLRAIGSHAVLYVIPIYDIVHVTSGPLSRIMDKGEVDDLSDKMRQGRIKSLKFSRVENVVLVEVEE